MESKSYRQNVFSSKFRILSFAILFAVISLLHMTSIEAAGWGKTEEIVEFEGVNWNGVYFDMNRCYFTANVPNYSGALMQNEMVSVRGHVEDNFAYLISTTIDKGFTPPKSKQEFVKMIQEANPDYNVKAISAGKFGAKYAVDLIPINQENSAFWRFLSTNNRLIQMGTNDNNNNRRSYFFDSIFIK